MIYIGDFKGYQVYQNDEGFLEAYKSSGVVSQTSKGKLANNHNRIVSNTDDLSVFITQYLTKKKKPKEIKDDLSNQLKLL